MESTLFDAVTDSSSLQRSSDCGNLLKQGILVNIKRVEKTCSRTIRSPQSVHSSRIRTYLDNRLFSSLSLRRPVISCSELGIERRRLSSENHMGTDRGREHSEQVCLLRVASIKLI
jgi:hypothetical protein